MPKTTFTCGRCGETKTHNSDLTTGYGTVPPDSDWSNLPTGTKICFECCGIVDHARMSDTKRAVLYDCESEVTNWPGTLRFEVSSRSKGRHNIARTRYDMWFVGPDGRPWWGVRYGDNTQIVHCKEIKSFAIY